jgi:hypothetical protein
LVLNYDPSSLCELRRDKMMNKNHRARALITNQGPTQFSKKEWCKLGTAAIFIKLRQKLQGHWNYYGVSGNYDRLRKYYYQVLIMTYKWLNRRSQRKSCNWQGFQEMLKHFRILRPRIVTYWN